MDIPKDCIHNLQADLSECLEQATSQPHNQDALQEAADIVRVLEYLERHPTGGNVDANKIANPQGGGVTYGGIDLVEQILDELGGAECYWAAYQQSGDDRYRQAAKQELGHAAMLETMLTEQGGDATAYRSKRQQLERVIR